jgi:tetratricopeptide (TPR) repeat protein
MKARILIFLFFFSINIHAQNEYLAQNYYDRGEFEKAIINYEELLKSNPNNFDFQIKLIDCYQQIQNFAKAEQIIKNIIQKYQSPQFYVELGYNFQLQKNQMEADKNYKIALKLIEENPNFIFSIAPIFEKKNLLEYALKSYQIGVAKNPQLNVNFQIGLLYGQLGNTDLMIENLMKEAFENQSNLYGVQNYFLRFMQNDTDEIFTNSLKKTLILAVQKNQEVFFNQMLSWFFVSIKDYKNSFIQEKAIFKKKPEGFSNLINLGEFAIEENKNEIAKEIYDYIKTQTKEKEVILTCNYNLLKIDIKNPILTREVILNQFDILFKEYPNYNLTDLKILYANYLAFNNIDIEKAKKFLKEEIDKAYSEKEKAQVKLELADIMMFDEKFNQSLILYSQVELDMKNDELAHQASYKIAKTSYFKQDFDWALTQLKVLKSASSQLIANDALEMYLLLNDNIQSDSTKTALIKFAKADFLLFKKNNSEALKIFEEIYKTHFKDDIADETLFKIASIHQKNGNFELALIKYQELLEKFTESIYKDEALFFAGNIYNEQLNLPEKAKEMYEKIILNHKDSIYFTDARNNFRKLRGDKLM